MTIQMDDKDLDEVLALKADAKSARDDGDWPEARAYLDEAIEFMREFEALVRAAQLARRTVR